MDPLKAQGQQEAKLHFLDYWRIIRIRKTVILAVFLLVFITATLVTYILPKAYASTARIKIEHDISDITGITADGVSRAGYDPYFIQTEFEVIQSEVVLGRVVDLLNLNAEFGKKYGGGTPFKTPESMGYLKSHMDLRPVRNTKLIEIRVFNEDPNEAARLANTIAQAYIDHRQAQVRDRSLRGIKTLQERFEEEEGKVRKLQTELDDLRVKLDISDSDAQGTAPTPSLESEALKQFERQRIENTMTYMGQKQLIENLKALPREKLKQVLPTTVSDGTLGTLLVGLNEAQQKLVLLGRDLGPDNPTVTTTKQLIDKLNQQIDERVDGIMVGLSNQVVVSKVNLDGLEKQVEEAKRKDQEKAEKSRPYYQKKQQLEELLGFRQTLFVKIAAEQIDAQLPKQGMVQIIDTAKPGDAPVRPNVTLNIVSGVVVGLVIGIALAFFIEYLDTSVKTIDDVERALQAPVLGVIPQNVGILLEEGAESPHAEAYRVLRTNLMFTRKDEKLNSVAMVSAGAGEGKSTTIFNTATVFAQSGHRVVVVDSDLRRPSLHKILKVNNNIGLTNYLLKQNTLEEVIQTTSLPLLDFMPSGKLPSSSLGILSSNQMKDLISELKRRYDFVFFDSPPIMGVSDASILASEVDMTIQVIQYRRYPQPMNIRAKQVVEKVGGNLVGIVLNNINVSQDESYYYYSGYYHDYYAQGEESQPQAAPAAAPTELAGGGGDDSKVEIKQKY